MPVVRLPLYGDGSALTGVATAAITNGLISLATADARYAPTSTAVTVAGKLDAVAGVASNLTVNGITINYTNGVTQTSGWWTNGAPAIIKSYLGTNYVESLY
jgi:hypothetical protein